MSGRYERRSAGTGRPHTGARAPATTPARAGYDTFAGELHEPRPNITNDLVEPPVPHDHWQVLGAPPLAPPRDMHRGDDENHEQQPRAERERDRIRARQRPDPASERNVLVDARRLAHERDDRRQENQAEHGQNDLVGIDVPRGEVDGAHAVEHDPAHEDRHHTENEEHPRERDDRGRRHDSALFPRDLSEEKRRRSSKRERCAPAEDLPDDDQWDERHIVR